MTSKLFTTLAAATTLAGIVTTAGAANAASFTQKVNYTPSDPDDVLDGGYVATDIDDTISFKQFNSSLGKLNSIKIDFTSSLKGNAGFENTGSAIVNPVTLNINGVLQLGLPTSGNLFKLDKLFISEKTTFAKSDKTLDYDGTSGKKFNGLTASISETRTFTDKSFLQYFIGKGNVDFTFLASAASTVTGSGNISSFINTSAKADVTVTYDYDAKSVPEPSALLGIGLAGVGIFLQSKKNRLKTSNS